jgi:hypothetical protein
MDIQKIIIIASVAIGIPLSIYALLNRRRKNKFSSLATELQGEYIQTGFFKPGKIAGNYKGKQFSLEPFTVGSGKSSSYRTAVNIECKYDKDVLVVRRDFFKNSQDWKCVHKLGQRKEKVLFWTLTLENSYIPIDENGKLLLQRVFDSLGIPPEEIIPLMQSKLYSPGSLHIGGRNVRLDIGGLLQDENKIKNILTFLKRVSDNIDKY